MKACFFAKVPDRSMLTYNQFYAQDIRILQSMCDDVQVAIRWSELPLDADIYFVWWWTWALVPIAVANVRRKPAIVTGVFDLANPMPGAWPSWPLWKQGITRAALRLATANVFVSELEYRGVPRTFRTKNPFYAPLVVDGELHPYGGHDRATFLLTVAWLNGPNPERKGVDLAMRAHARLLQRRPSLDLVIAGAHGDALPRLKDLAAALGTVERVKFVGRVDHTEKVRLLQTCAAYLQPSVFEGFGVAAAEAVACGAAVVACRTGTLPEVLGDDAFFASDRTPEAVEAAVERALTSWTLEASKAAAARITTRFSFDERRRRLKDIIESVASGEA